MKNKKRREKGEEEKRVRGATRTVKERSKEKGEEMKEGKERE